jgi:hypothetical protein
MTDRIRIIKTRGAPLDPDQSQRWRCGTFLCAPRNSLSNCPRGCSNNCHLPFMFVTGTVSFCDITTALPNYGAGRLNSAILLNGFVDPIECSAPTAVCFRTINALWQMCCAPVIPCANKKCTSSGLTS